ncbi:sensor histidine kinase [Sporosarcina sp. YIM B06819]|uniref:sensor histidine kinase n=1 Tax=Sporosarcina sp. YIM B06819 TaxID=3081769 RepID=UPI00298C903E|nr:sensor histidine kinase [Sporosarcina sp. YIM B06819]
MRWFHSLFFKLLLCLLLISVFPVITVGWLTYNKASQSITEKLNFHANYILEQKVVSLNNLHNTLVRMDYAINANKHYSTFSENKSLTAHQQLYIDLDKLLRSIETALPEMVGITMINKQGFIYSYGYSFNSDFSATDIYNTDWFQSFDDYTSAKITKPHTREYSNFEKEKKVHSYIHKVWDYKINSFNYIIIDFDVSLIADLLGENADGKVFSGTFIYGNGDLVLPPKSSLGFSRQMIKKHQTGLEITNNIGKKFIVFKRTHPLTNWTIVEYFDAEDFYKSILDTKIITLIIVFTSIVVCIFASLFVSHKISFPINKMRKKMIEVESGVFNQEFITNSKDEIGDLARGFNHMLFKIKELIDSVVQETKLKKEAEVTALQLQINPHFIYNTLESINSLARMKKEYEISHLIVLLGRLLRLSISTFDEEVTINQEISYIVSYLEIQKIRMREPLHYHISIDPSIGSLLTIKWILQPIVENAIIHGIDPLQSSGNVDINGKLKDDHILFEIRDNGKGIDQATLDEIRYRLKYKSSNLTKYKNKVGLYNVQTRILSRFGSEFGIYINSTVNEGTTVTIKIPIMDGDL